jgi:hypothetical protein
MAEGTSPGKEDLGSRAAGVVMECGYGAETSLPILELG